MRRSSPPTARFWTASTSYFSFRMLRSLSSSPTSPTLLQVAEVETWAPMCLSNHWQCRVYPRVISASGRPALLADTGPLLVASESSACEPSFFAAHSSKLTVLVRVRVRVFISGPVCVFVLRLHPGMMISSDGLFATDLEARQMVRYLPISCWLVPSYRAHRYPRCFTGCWQQIDVIPFGLSIYSGSDIGG